VTLRHRALDLHARPDGLALGALVAFGRAVALLPALRTAAVPQLVARRLREERLQRTSSPRPATTAEAPAVIAVRPALHDTAGHVATARPDLDVLP